MLNDLVNRGLDARNVNLVLRDDNSGRKDAVLSILGDVVQQACAVRLKRNISDMVHKEHRAEFQPMVSEIFKSSSEAQARKRLTEVLDRWEPVQPKACLTLRRRVDASSFGDTEMLTLSLRVEDSSELQRRNALNRRS